jgi:hypothetical protein
MSNGVGIGWRGEQPLYDTINLAIGAVGGAFFTVPFGGAIGALIKGNQHTNLTLAGQLEIGSLMEVDAISMYARQSLEAGALPLDADVRAIYSGNIRFNVGVTEELRIPAQVIPSGGADFVFFSNIAAAATEYYVAKGVSANANVYRLRTAIQINGGVPFSVILENCDPITAVTEVTFVLWGTLTKPVSRS